MTTRRSARVRKKALTSAGLAVLSGVGAVGYVAVEVQVADAHADRNYSAGIREAACSRNWAGSAMNQNDRNLYLNSYGDLHINSVLWSSTRSGCGDWWIEGSAR
jgi:hypothetical protein